MKIAVTSTGKTVDDPMDPRFGRCSCFILVDPETMDFEALENTSASLSTGAGIQAAQALAQQGVKTIITGNCGPNAFQTLEAAGIAVIVGVSGTVHQAVEQFRSGTLEASAQANATAHQGIGTGGGTGGGGLGRGLGRGMGGGMGRGMGGGMGRGMCGGGGMGGMGRRQSAPMPVSEEAVSSQPAYASPLPGTESAELADLKENARSMTRMLEEIMKRIEKLEAKK